LTRLAARLLCAPAALISLRSGDHQVLKSSVGLPELWPTGKKLPLSHLLGEPLLTGEQVVINDARHIEHLRENPALTELRVVAYLGFPLTTRSGLTLGSFCAMDTRPREWSPDQIETLGELAGSAAREIELWILDLQKQAVSSACCRTTTSLHQRDAQLRQLVETVQAIPWEADPNSRAFSFVGPQAARLLGYPVENWYQPDFWIDHLHPDDRARAVNYRLQSAHLGEGHEIEYRMVAEDGRDVWIRDLVPAVSGELSPAVRRGYMFDITERKQAELASQDSHAILRAVTEGTSDAVFVKDSDGRYLMINSAGARFMGATAPEVVGRHDTDFFTPDTVDQVLDSDRAVLASGETTTREERITAAGVTRTYLATKGPLRDEEGRISGTFGISRDISDRVAAEEGLRASEVRFRTICEAAPIGVFLVDAEGNDTYANGEKLRQLNLPAIEALGTGWTRVLHPEDRERVLAAWTEAVRRGMPFESTCRFQHADGRVVWSEVRVLPLREGERTLGYVGASLDITQRKQAEEALQQQKEQLQTVLDHIPVMVVVFDTEGRVIYANPEWERVLGWQVREALQLDLLAELYPDPDYRAGAQEFIQRADARWCDFKTRVRDGRVLDTSWANVRLSNGWHIGIGQDISERKRAEERTLAFRGLGQRLNETMNPEAAARVVLDVADRLLGWDSCWLELVTPDRMSARNVVQIDLVDGKRSNIPPPAPGLPATPMALRAIDGGPFLILREPEEHLPGESPARASASILCAPIRSRDQAVGALSIQSYSYGAYSDEDLQVLQSLADYCAGALERTQAEEARARLQQQLAQAQKMEAVGRLAGGVAHDFNNMLAVINGYSSLLLPMTEPDSPLRQGLHDINRAGERAADLTRQLLAFSRKQLLETRVLNLNELLQHTERLLRRLIGEDVEFVTHLDPALGQVKADPSQVDQILMNLAANARDAMPQGGRITIETRNVEIAADYPRTHPEVPPGLYVLLSISDTGCGMQPETLERIWEPFFTTKGEGTGLGLATIYGIVKQSGGHVEVESEPGAGATFRVYLPRIDLRAAADCPEPLSPLAGSETVLVVEDEAMVRNFVRSVLELSGYTVLEARDGDDAVSTAREHGGPIHLLLTDVVMPGGMGGREVAEQLVQLRPDLKVLFMSGYTDDAVVRHGVQHQGVAFIQKPFTPAALTGKLRELLS